MSEYPYYVEIYDIQILDTEINNCILLDSLIREFYPSTQVKKSSVAEFKSRRYQKSHLRLTASSKKYIDKLFDCIRKKYGLAKY